MSRVALGHTRAKKAGAQAPADAPNPHRYRVLLTQNIIHVHYVEAPDAAAAENLAWQQFYAGDHQKQCTANGCSCTHADIIDTLRLNANTD